MCSDGVLVHLCTPESEFSLLCSSLWGFWLSGLLISVLWLYSILPMAFKSLSYIQDFVQPA
ncbi:hypothetical protein K469DRAFT_293068 [Zopfia rhizophila CBS 207.26]|uniref:Uncharacterized protein n=1 Tax=Zopfia rhizophila CBS 207.26 TaxID=1314779 RepID=A0A6A6DNP9_9PEZI|nr:hypothetical protein K469DRAFT_293068 [Zopfia rhizophila CBS 207.26]